MKNSKKQNEISVLCEMASTVADNISKLQSVLNSNSTTEFSFTDTLFFDLLQTTEKNYFSAVEREDIFILGCHIQNMNDEIRLITERIAEDFFFNKDKLKTTLKYIAILLSDCVTMLRELEKIPKCNGMTQLYFNFRKHISDSDRITDNQEINNFKNQCKKIAETIYFSYLKNT